jgi:hypothetical protein
MGTSTRWPGPSGGGWRASSNNLTRTLHGVADRAGEAPVPAPREPDSSPPAMLFPDEIERTGIKFQEALTSTLLQDQSRFGLIDGLEAAGGRLLDTLETLDRRIPDWLAASEGKTAEDRRNEFVMAFVDEVTGAPGFQTDAAIRSAATDSAFAILQKDASIARAVETSSPYNGRITGELFCDVYRIFFAEAVASFLQSVIAAKITLVIPILPAIDPAGHIAGWIAKKLMSILPTPCERQEGTDNGESLANLGRSILKETVARALGLPLDGTS